MIKIKITTISIILLLFSQLIAQDVFLKITDSGRSLIKVGVVDFVIDDDDKFDEKVNNLSKKIPEIIKKDLKFSLFFDIIDTGQIPQKGAIKEDDIDFPSWASIGVQAIVLGTIKRDKNSFEIQLFVESVILRKRVFKRTYQIKEGEERRLAHSISDEITKLLTGEDGVCRTRIFFVSNRSGNKEIYVSDYDGFDVDRLTYHNSITIFPTVSPDNSSVIYSSFKDGWLKLYKYDIADKDSDLLSGYKGLNGPSSYSPDGKKIAVVLSKDDNSEIYIMDVRTKRLERITYEPSIDTSPCFSPNGNQIAFTSDRSGTPQIYIMDVSGANVRKLTFNGSYNDQPSWSPRGDKIAFATKIRGVFDIGVITIDGESQYVLTDIGNNQNPSWAPDGYHIAFSSNRDGPYKLYSMGWDGTEINLISTSSEDFKPVWSSRYNWNFVK